MTGKASVCLSFEALGQLLHLSDQVTLAGVRVDQMAETVDFLIEGDGLPRKGRREDRLRVPLSTVIDWELQ